MAAHLRLLSFFSTFAVLCSFHVSNGGFTVDLIQRDSALSPSYNASHSYFDRLHNAFRRSISRVNRFKPRSQSKSSIQSMVVATDGEYLMQFSIGTPPVKVLGVADTGSDLTWTQCKPCEQCYKQSSSLFEPDKSSTYRAVECKSVPCAALDASSCGFGTCQYSYSYGDQSFTNGNLAVETLTISPATGRPVLIPNVVFGCGHHNDGTFGEAGSGIVGLGGGSLSLVSQLKKSIGGKFSYCLRTPLTDTNATSKITFGRNSGFSGNGVALTPLVAKEPATFYYLTLEAISVGNKRILYKGLVDAAGADEGNIIIDSGTTLTFLPPEFHADLVSALEKAIDAERVIDPRNVLSLCFRSQGDIHVPIITVHFTGADVKLQPVNTFVRVEVDMVCFTMAPSDSLAIYGNLAQMNFRVGYDLEAKTVSFLPADCTKH